MALESLVIWSISEVVEIFFTGRKMPKDFWINEYFRHCIFHSVCLHLQFHSAAIIKSYAGHSSSLCKIYGLFYLQSQLKLEVLPLYCVHPLFKTIEKTELYVFHHSIVSTNCGEFICFSPLIQIRKVSLKHAGRYTCTASNDAGSTMTSGTLFVSAGEWIVSFLVSVCLWCQKIKSTIDWPWIMC